MRWIFLILVPLATGTASATEPLQFAEQLYQSGAINLALGRVVRYEPRTPDAPAWYDWESLRLTLLSQLHRPADLLARIELVPTNAPRDFLQKAYGHAAWAHLERSEGEAARGYLARLLWGFPLSVADQQWARRLVIRSYLVEHKPEDAYRAMLRYQQDFAPLATEVATEFAKGLLAEGRATDAMTWLAVLDPASPVALELQLKSGLVPPERAIALAQDALKTNPSAMAYASILVDAAEMTRDSRLRVAALELTLNSDDRTAGNEMDLWHAYMTLAAEEANRTQLLQGDDPSWLAMAEGLASSEPGVSRAVYAYLAERGITPGTRETALARLFASLVASGRDAVAVRLFAAAPWGGEKPSPERMDRVIQRAVAGMPVGEARPLLMAAGRLAEEEHGFEVAADYYAQAVLASDLREPDWLATQALKSSVDNLERAGFRDDAVAFYRKVVSMREPAKKPAPVSPPPAEKKRTKKGKRKK
jgi:hypothetical protein